MQHGRLTNRDNAQQKNAGHPVLFLAWKNDHVTVNARESTRTPFAFKMHLQGRKWAKLEPPQKMHCETKETKRSRTNWRAFCTVFSTEKRTCHYEHKGCQRGHLEPKGGSAAVVLTGTSRVADFGDFPVADRPKSGPEGRFPARKH